MNTYVRRFILPLFLLLFLAPARAEVIRSFDVAMRLNPDTSLDVQETIAYDFESAQRHGIYRNIPVRYDRYGGSYSIYLNLVSVTDEKGKKLQYETARQGRDLSIKIGDPDVTITGLHTYVLRYRVRRAINFFNKAPEVYWNATGNQWPCAMQQVTARFYPPIGFTSEQIKTACYIGPPGSTTPGQIGKQSDHILFSTGQLEAGSGLTLVAGLPAGSVEPPTLMQNVLWFLADWWPALFFPLLALGTMITLWHMTGRDVDDGLAIAVEWNPPKDLSPAEVGTLVDERCDMADIVSTLVDLAARGYLVIEETEVEKFLFLSKRDYRFIKVPREYDVQGDGLAPHEREFLRGLFATGDRVLLSSLKNKFYTYLPTIRDGIYQELVSKHIFAGNPNTTRNIYGGTGIGIAVLGVVAAIIGAESGNIAWGVGLVLAGVIVLMWARAMPAKTAKGSRLYRESMGFARFVRLAEKDRIRVLAESDPTIFGRLLPYAIVLGVADDWADKFSGLMTQPPDWYVPYGYGPNYHFSSPHFVRDLGGGMNTMGSTFASQPQSSGGSGGSGFSGGGSGGGFGGGGGGSW